MREKKRVLIGMSGGVDSAVAAMLLKEQGYEVIGATMILCGADCHNEDAKRVCDFLGIKHYNFDFRNEFTKHVINDFINEYKNARTPNPCIECNKYLKFGAMYEKAVELGCEYIATGHYADVEFNKNYNKYVLKQSSAGKKDQSYVLYSIPATLLDKILFPLAHFSNKAEIREIAEKNNLPVANKPDSEDICFIPDGDYKRFIEDEASSRNSNQDFSKNSSQHLKDNIVKSGNIVDTQGNILGTHNGIYRYTIGQRKGLGIAYKEPLFVKEFNIEKNEVVVGTHSEVYKNEFIVERLNWLLIDELKEKMKVEVKIRYSSAFMAAEIIPMNENTVKVTLKEPQRAITPGQSAVFYIDGIVVGGGKIK